MADTHAISTSLGGTVTIGAGGACVSPLPLTAIFGPAGNSDTVVNDGAASQSARL